MNFPVSVMRKKAELMEVELGTLRKALTQEEYARRRERRQVRRLHRRCQVRGHEDVDELERQFAASRLEQLAAPWEKVAPPLPAPGARPAARAFFAELTRPRRPPAGALERPVFSPAVSAVVTRRVAPHLHTARRGSLSAR